MCGYHLPVAQGFIRSTDPKKVPKILREYVEHCIVPKDIDKQVRLHDMMHKEDKTTTTLMMMMMKGDGDGAGREREGDAGEEVVQRDPEEVAHEKTTANKVASPLLRLNREIVNHILSFLDPFSLGKVCTASHDLYHFATHPSLYKERCTALYQTTPTLPADSPFLPIVEIITNASWGEFTADVVASVNADFRSLVWVPDVNAFKTPLSFYKKYQDWRSLYLHCPRVRLDGLYSLKEKYIRRGQRKGDQWLDPVYVVEFYRYVRFLQNGLVVTIRSVKKQSMSALVKMFDLHRLKLGKDEGMAQPHQQPSNPNQATALTDEKVDALFGEYIVKEGVVHMKFFNTLLIYEIEAKILSTKVGMNDCLIVNQQNHRNLGMLVPIKNIYYEQATKGFVKGFKFRRVPEFIQDITDKGMRAAYP